ncbi:recombinase family protein [Actinomycetota bacterium]
MAERGLIYGRASSDPKHRGSSVDDQIRECRSWAEANDVKVVRVIRDDNRSASATAKRRREGFETVLELIKARSIDLLIVWEASRAARDMAVFIELRGACRAAGVEMSYKGRRFDLSLTNDSFNATLDALLAERDASEIRDRNMRTVRRNAELKRPHGRLPYGYQRVYDATTGALLGQTPYVLADTSGKPATNADGRHAPVLPGSGEPMVLSPEAQVLVEAAEAVLAGTSLRKITLALTDRGVPSPRQPNRKTLAENPAGVVTTWHPQSLRQRLLNPAIAGRRVFRGEDIGDASWAPILDYGTWLKLRAVLSDPARLSVAPRGPEARHLLSNIARCGECGVQMKAKTNSNRLPRAYSCENELCRRVTVTAPRVEEMVEALIVRLLDTDGFRTFLTDAFRQREQSHGTVDVRGLIAAKEVERDELESLRKAGGISLRAYAAEDLRIEEELEQLRSQEIAPVRSAALRQLLGADSVAVGWEAASLVDKREVIRLLLDVRVHRATKRGRAFDIWRVQVTPGDFLLDSWTRHGELEDEQLAE